MFFKLDKTVFNNFKKIKTLDFAKFTIHLLQKQTNHKFQIHIKKVVLLSNICCN